MPRRSVSMRGKGKEGRKTNLIDGSGEAESTVVEDFVQDVVLNVVTKEGFRVEFLDRLRVARGVKNQFDSRSGQEERKKRLGKRTQFVSLYPRLLRGWERAWSSSAVFCLGGMVGRERELGRGVVKKEDVEVD